VERIKKLLQKICFGGVISPQAAVKGELHRLETICIIEKTSGMLKDG
jgi:hypothetical protein